MSETRRPGSSSRYRHLIAWAVITLLIGVIAAQARFTSDLQALLPANDPELNRILEFLKGRSASRLIAIEGWAEAGSGAGSDDVRKALLGLPALLKPHGATPLPQPGPQAMVHLVNVVEDHLPLLITEAQLADIAKRLNPPVLLEYLRALKDRVTRPEDEFTATASRLDVMAVGGAPMQELAAQMAGTGFADGVVSHPDGVHFLLPLDVDFDPGEVDKSKALMEALEEASTRARVKHIHLEVIGAYRHFNDNMSSLFLDFWLTIPLGVLLIVGMLYSLTRSWKALIAMHVPALLGVMGAVATLALVGGNVPLPLIGFAATLLGVTVDYGIQMTAALRAGDHTHIHPPLLRSCLISACAFAALIPSPVPALHSLGIMVLGGLVVAYLAARWLLPAVVSLDPRPDPWRRVTLPVLRWCEGSGTRNFMVAAVITALLAPGMWRLHMLSDIQRMDGSKPATRAALNDFLDRWGSLESSNFLVATAPSLDEALDKVAAARVSLHLPPSRIERFLPSRGEQERNRASWNRFWNERGQAFRNDFTAACISLKLRPTAFDASLARYRPVENSTILTQQDWNDTPLELPLSQLVTRSGAGWQVASPVDDLNREEVQALPTRVASLKLDPVWVATRVHFAERLVDVLKGDLGERALVISLAILIAVIVMVRRVRPCVAMLLPPATALVWTFGLLGWMGEELTPFTVLVAAFVGGIGIDCAVFLSQPENRQRLISPVIACIATAICGTAAMLFAHHPLLAGVGQTLTIGMGTCLIACLLLTPVVAGRQLPAPGRGEEDERTGMKE